MSGRKNVFCYHVPLLKPRDKFDKLGLSSVDSKHDNEAGGGGTSL